MQFIVALLSRTGKAIANAYDKFMAPRTLTSGQEAYLAGAKNHCELEQRIRELERGSVHGFASRWY